MGLMARGRDGLEGAYAEVRPLGGDALILPTDVSDPQAVEAAAAKVEETFGPIDIWVNNAMTSVFSPFVEMTPEEFKRVTEVTYLGYVYGTMSALRRMRRRDRGTIIQVGSALARRSIPLQSDYCGAKHAIEGFTDSIRSELLSTGSRIYLTMVQLPAVNTPQFGWVKSRLPNLPQPVPPIYQPEVIARAIYWLAHHRRREFDIGGSTAMVIALNKFFPGLGDIYLAHTGIRSQQTAEPADPNRPNNLWQPVPGDHGAHGSFSNRAFTRSYQVWMNQNRGALALLGLGLVGLGLRRKTKRPSEAAKLAA
jgi:NAD(P)-dependent dehydrogenase (short-subunit alcohol dehydrogenase family)